jgi:hypothetical protein
MKVRHVFVLAVAVSVALLPGAASASSGWQITPTPPNPHGTQLGAVSYLASVSCISASACTAVGEADPASSNGAHGGGGPGYALAEHWNGTAWKIQSAPTPADAQAGSQILAGVKCISASFCMAVGSYETSTSFNEVAFAERWNGTVWKIQSISQPPADNFLNAVACTTATNCIAVGWTNSSGNVAPLAEHWNGTSWSPMSVPVPAGAADPQLTAVSCTAASACTAVGEYTVGSYPNGPYDEGLAERWNGKTWTIQNFAVPANAQINIYGVKCISATACTAVGSQHDASFSFLLTLAEFWNGNSWQIQPTPNPPNSGSELYAISCTPLNACTAIGSGPMAENWNGTSWQIQPMPGAGSQLGSVWCTSATACMAVGREITADVEGVRTVVTLAERRT